MQGTQKPQPSLAGFKALAIDVPPSEVQRKIVAVSDLARREREVCEGIVRLRAGVVRQACTRAARRGRSDGEG